MGSIGGLLGLNGGANGTGFAGPQSATITPGTNAGQIGTAYGGAQNSLQSQQALLAALQGQGGLANQSQVYNQLQGVANGTGPNPAQAMLNQSTGQNIANQAALMAGQRGAGANVGLIARQAGMQGAGIQQNAIGQGATLQANQSLNALGAAGNIAGQQVANQIGATGMNTQANQSEQQLLQNSLASQNQNNVGMQSNINNANAGLANTQMQGQQGLIGGLLGGAGAALGMGGAPVAAKAEGGMIGFADGGVTSGPQSSFGQFLSGMGGSMTAGGNPLQSGMTTFGKGLGTFLRSPAAPAAPGVPGPMGVAPMGKMDATAPVGLGVFAQGGNVGSQLQTGGNVPGKAKVQGNSLKNDKVKALLSPGELVVDRETMADKGAAGQAARFLAAVIAAKKKGAK